MGNTENNELNLIQILDIIFKWIYNLFKQIIVFWGRLLQLSVKHWIVYLSFILLGVLVGLYLGKDSKQKFKADTTVYVSYSKANLVKDIIEHLKEQPEKNKELSLATKLSIPDSVASSIISMEMFNIIDYTKDEAPDVIDFKNKHSLADTMNIVMNDRFFLRVKTKNPNHIKTFEKALLDYINSNQRLISEFESKTRAHLEKVSYSDIELKRLDSLSNILYFRDKTQSASVEIEKNKLLIGDYKKPLLYQDVYNVLSNKEYSQRYLMVAKKPVYLVDSFAISGPIYPRRILLIYGLICGIIAGFIAVFVFDNLKTIIKFLKNQ